MFIDFVGLMLINMAAGLATLAVYVCRGLDEEDQRKWAPALALPAFVALMCGFRMIWTWPLPGSYNVAYGESSILLGIPLAGAAVALALDWSLLPVTVYAFFGGVVSIVVGVAFINLGLSKYPLLTGVGFILTGLAGVFAGPTLCMFRSNRFVRSLGALTLLAAAVIWAFTGYGAYWMHIQAFMKYMPH